MDNRNRYLIPVKEKRCPVCGEIKPASGFWQDRRNVSGLQRSCKKCQKAYYREYSMRIDRKEYRKNYHIINNQSIREKKWLHREHNLGYLDADGCCLICFEINPFKLHNHHVFGEKENPDFAIHLCANCHELIHRFPIYWIRTVET